MRDIEWGRADEEPAPPLDLARILEVLDRHGVDFLVIGGFAVIAHGNPRATFDLDIVASLVDDNLRALGAALRELHARIRGVDADLLDVDPLDPDDLGRGGNWTLVTDAGRLDVLPDVPGARPYDLMRDAAVQIDASAGRFRVVGLGDLIRMKEAAGRDKDRADLAALSRVHELDLPRADPVTPRQAAAEEGSPGRVCGAWMPRVRTRCGLPAGHTSRHRRRP